MSKDNSDFFKIKMNGRLLKIDYLAAICPLICRKYW